MAVVHLPSDAFAAAGDWAPDWGAGHDARAEADAFQSTAEFAASLQMPVSDSAAENMRAAADHAAARAEALPQHLQLGGRPWRDHSPELAEVQAIQAREVEHARYRDVADHPRDVDIQAVLQAMRYSARAELPKFEGGKNLHELPWAPSRTSDGPQEFLVAAHQRSLWATHLREWQPRSQALRAKFAKLLKHLPDI